MELSKVRLIDKIRLKFFSLKNLILLYFKYFQIVLKSEMQYKQALYVGFFSQILSCLTSLIGVYFLFDKFGSIEGFLFHEVLICFSISYVGFSLTECFFRGFDNFDTLISNGKFDIMLIRPQPVLFQIIGEIIEIKKLGRSTFAISLLIFVIAKNPILWSPEKIFAIIFMIIGTVVIYSGLFIIKATICFYTTSSLEIMNIFTDGARDLTQYPLTIYKKAVLDFFTYIIPLALVNLYPFLYIIGKSEKKAFIFLPMITFFYLIPCYIFWKIGLKKYKSTGS